ncbi:MAG: nucleotide exchange factor GrpE [Nautiliaceae bacterium]|jgi:molecular chaperone GrpE
MSKKKHKHNKKEHKETKTQENSIDIGAIQKENEELKNKLEEALRAYAKCENDKKLLQKEADNAIEYAYEKFAKDLLPVVDSLELAIAHANDIENKEDAFDKLVEGVELTLKKLLDTFKNHGIEPIEHNEFNPEFHQAIQQVNSDVHEDGAIVDIYQKGYTLKGRVIRPSMVTINKK